MGRIKPKLQTALNPEYPKRITGFRFKTKKLEDLYTQEKDAHKYPAAVVDSFFEVMEVIEATLDETDLYALKGYHFEKLSGNRQGQRSIRLNQRWRLIVELNEDQHNNKYWLIVEINKHYR